jgi:phage virion morphogenesis protein
MITIDVQVTDAGASRKLQELIDRGADLTPVYATIGRVLVNRIRLGFKMGTSPYGNAWAKLKIRRGEPLRDTGRLQRSITARADASGVVIGTNLKQAPVHQFGATINAKPGRRLVFPGPGGRLIFAKRVTIPARPFMPLVSRNKVELPPDWALSASRALRDYFQVRG